VIRAALYARVSSEKQAEEGAIGSQVAALRDRATADGCFVDPEDVYLDEGVSGALLIRPALERLRDRAAAGAVDRIYIHSPDRLARKMAYQMLLLEEFGRSGLEVIFLNRPASATPEDELLMQVQGVIVEYERAKILERIRRGKLHRARGGEVSALGGAPYGYRYVRKADGIPARYEIVEGEAAVVQRVFRQYVLDRLTFYEISRRLGRDGIPTRLGHKKWDPGTLSQMVRNPAYMGLAAFGKTSRQRGENPGGSGRRQPSVAKRGKTSCARVAVEKWIRIPVPAIVSEELFESAQEQLRQNQRFADRNSKPGRHLLRGLVVCAECHYSCAARSPWSTKRGGDRRYYYR